MMPRCLSLEIMYLLVEQCRNLRSSRARILSCDRSCFVQISLLDLQVNTIVNQTREFLCGLPHLVEEIVNPLNFKASRFWPADVLIAKSKEKGCKEGFSPSMEQAGPERVHLCKS